MSETSRLLDAARKALDCNDSELARHLGQSKSHLSEWRRGKVPMPDLIAVKLAKLAGQDPARALAALQAEKAPANLAPMWQEVLRRLGPPLGFLALLSALPATQNSAQAAEPNVYYVKSRKRARDRWYWTPSVKAHLKATLHAA